MWSRVLCLPCARSRYIEATNVLNSKNPLTIEKLSFSLNVPKHGWVRLHGTYFYGQALLFIWCLCVLSHSLSKLGHLMNPTSPPSINRTMPTKYVANINVSIFFIYDWPSTEAVYRSYSTLTAPARSRPKSTARTTILIKTLKQSQ
jgi:hypothetical protein